MIGALADEAHEMSDRLGDEHDLTVLREWGAPARERALNGAEPVLRGFDVILENRQRELQQEAFEYGVRIYADKPSVCSWGGSRLVGGGAERAVARSRVDVERGPRSRP